MPASVEPLRAPVEARGCARCPQLAAARTQVVLGAGDPDTALMFVAEAPGADEDAVDAPLTGRAGALLDELLAGIGLAREAVFVTNAVLCRPPANRDPTPAEVTSCTGWLERQVELVRPVVVCALGGFVTKLLRGDTAPLARVRGQAELREIGSQTVRLLPLLHPAAALYRPATVEVLRRDMAQIPELLALGAPPQPRAAQPEPAEAADGQLGLF